MADVSHAVSQVPFTGIALVILVSCGIIAFYSDEKKKDVLRYMKGVILTVLLSVVVFMSVAVPKYFGYFKIDIMQLGVWGVGFVALVIAFLIAVKTMGDGKADILSKVPYPLKQVALFAIVFSYFFFSETELEVFWLVVGALPFNVLYHLYYVKALDRVFAFALRMNERFDEKFMAKTGE